MGGLLNTSAFLRHNGLGTRSQLSAGKKITAANTFATVSSIVVAVCWGVVLAYDFFFFFFIFFFIFLFLFLVVAVCWGMARGAAEGSLIRLFSFSFFCCGSVWAYDVFLFSPFSFLFLLWQCIGVWLAGLLRDR